MGKRRGQKARLALGIVCCTGLWALWGSVSCAAEALDGEFRARVTAALDRAIQAFNRLGRDGAYLDEYTSGRPHAADRAQVRLSRHDGTVAA